MNIKLLPDPQPPAAALTNCSNFHPSNTTHRRPDTALAIGDQDCLRRHNRRETTVAIAESNRFCPSDQDPKIHAAVYIPWTPAERLPLVLEPLLTPTSLALLEHCRRKFVERIEVLKRLEQLPSSLG